MKSKIVFVSAICLILILVVAGSWTAVALGQQAVNASNHRWCTALELITSKPVPKPPDPVKNPSREQNYQAYAAYVQLRREFGCDR